jgi:hypothetical protein
MRRALLTMVLACAALFAPVAAQAAQPPIVGGNGTTIGEWPWQVAVASPPAPGEDGFDRQFCGGTLVAPTIVITAAHCVYDFVDPTGLTCIQPLAGFNNPASEFYVITGRTRLSSSAGQDIPVAEIYYFEPGPVAQAQSTGDGEGLYDCDASSWDVVFLELASPSTSQPIKLAGPDETATWEPDRDAFITGWGDTTGDGDYSDDLMEAQIHMISDAFCGSGPAYGSEFQPETMVCAGEIGGGQDTCQGDSGGPLVVPLDGGGFRLVGDTSFGEGCAQPNKPGIYGRIAADPMRTALAQGVASVVPGTDIVGSGGTPPGTGASPVPSGGSDDAACAKARTKLHAAKKRLRQLRRADAPKRKLKRAEKKVRRAKKKVKRVCT